MGDARQQDSDDWQPATSRPGELYTPSGQIRSVGVFFRSLRNKDPRLQSYRRPMLRIALSFVALAVGVVAVAVVLQALF